MGKRNTAEAPHRATNTNDARIAEGLELVDGGLTEVYASELVAATRVADLLLDIRSALTAEGIVEIEGADR